MDVWSFYRIIQPGLNILMRWFILDHLRVLEKILFLWNFPSEEGKAKGYAGYWVSSRCFSSLCIARDVFLVLLLCSLWNSFSLFSTLCFSYAFLSLISLISRLNSSILLTIFSSKGKCEDLITVEKSASARILFYDNYNVEKPYQDFPVRYDQISSQWVILKNNFSSESILNSILKWIFYLSLVQIIYYLLIRIHSMWKLLFR